MSHQCFTLHLRAPDDKTVYARYTKPFFQALKYQYPGIRYEWVKHVKNGELHLHGIIQHEHPVNKKWFYRKWKYLRDKHGNPYQPREAWLRPAEFTERWIAYLFGMHWGTKRHYTLVAPWEGAIGRICDGNLGRCS